MYKSDVYRVKMVLLLQSVLVFIWTLYVYITNAKLVQMSIEHVDDLSMDEFVNKYVKNQLPVAIKTPVDSKLSGKFLWDKDIFKSTTCGNAIIPLMYPNKSVSVFVITIYIYTESKNTHSVYTHTLFYFI